MREQGRRTIAPGRGLGHPLLDVFVYYQATRLLLPPWMAKKAVGSERVEVFARKVRLRSSHRIIYLRRTSSTEKNILIMFE